MIADDGTYYLDAASPGLTSETESTSIYIVGAATQLYVKQEPPSPVEAGSTWGFIVGADDAFGNPTPIFSGNVTVAMGVNPGGSNPSGVSETVPVVGGFATFTGLTLNKVGMGYTLDVTSSMLTSTTAGPITVDNAPATQLVITPAADEPPSSVTAGQTFGLTVTAEDPYGNVDSSYSGHVSISLVGPARSRAPARLPRRERSGGDHGTGDRHGRHVPASGNGQPDAFQCDDELDRGFTGGA